MLKCKKCNRLSGTVKGVSLKGGRAYVTCRPCGKDWWMDLLQYDPPKICGGCNGTNTLYIVTSKQGFYSYKCASCRALYHLKVPRHIPEEQVERYIDAKV